MVACFALIFGYHGNGRDQISGKALTDLAAYVDACIVELAKRCGANHPLAQAVRGFAKDIAALKEGQSLDLRPADYFYRLLAFEPFASFVKNENRARNLAVLSQLLNTFQNYYHYTVVTFKNREYLRYHLFNSFLRLLHEGGINEYEDPDQPFPKGYVQVMTIHQAKGLEFPVVVVGSLHKQTSPKKQIDRDLQPFYQRPPFEPENRVTEFDRMRLHYVAFSRPEKVLVLTCPKQPKDHFDAIWQGLPQWPHVQRDLLAAQSFELKDRIPLKRSFSFTDDLKLYETCPRQYQFFREYDFTPSRSAVIFFGLLVHQTIEEVHRLVLDGKLAELDEPRIRSLFDRTFNFLTLADVRPIGPAARESAFNQVMNYFRQNQAEMQRVVETEVDVSVEKDDYILTGKVDLLMGGDLPAPRSGVFFVYAIECEGGSYYVGHTDDLRRRWTEHSTGIAAEWTRRHKPVRVAHYEEAASRKEAVQRERNWKTGYGRKYLKRLIESGRARQAGGKLELLDFKTSPRPTNSPKLLQTYERQLCTLCAHPRKTIRQTPRASAALLDGGGKEGRRVDAISLQPAARGRSRQGVRRRRWQDTSEGLSHLGRARKVHLQRVRHALLLRGGGSVWFGFRNPSMAVKVSTLLGSLVGKLASE